MTIAAITAAAPWLHVPATFRAGYGDQPESLTGTYPFHLWRPSFATCHEESVKS